MKILMFGWEFPPHISGGLGTACYGLTKGLSSMEDMEITFVVPKAWGDENQTTIRLMGANEISTDRHFIEIEKCDSLFEYIEINSGLVPYISPEEFMSGKKRKYPREKQLVEVNEEGKIDFKGSYGTTLFQETRNYAIVAEKIASTQSFDLIHAHDWLTFPAGIAAHKKTGKPLVIHVHATEFERNGENINPEIFSIEREGMEAADRIITVSNLTRQIVIDKYEIDPGKIMTVYNAVGHQAEVKESVFKKGPRDKIVTFLGRITYQKGPEYFIEAAALVLKKMDNVRFVMAGSGDMMPAMTDHVARLGISDKFHFTGFLQGNDVLRILQGSDLFVMPSVSEPFGIVPLEAMQANVPVIITKQSGVAEILKYALKVDFWDTFGMADAIYGLLNYPSLPKLFIQQGKKESGNLKWENAAQEVVKVYQSALSSKQ
jgi:glycosyltransferase involved in cell wall biosynthesis